MNFPLLIYRESAWPSGEGEVAKWPGAAKVLSYAPIRFYVMLQSGDFALLPDVVISRNLGARHAGVRMGAQAVCFGDQRQSITSGGAEGVAVRNSVRRAVAACAGVTMCYCSFFVPLRRKAWDGEL